MVESDRLAVLADCTFELPLALEDEAEAPACLRHVALEALGAGRAPQPERRLVLADRLFELPALGQRRAEVVVGLPESRIDADRLAELADRILVPALLDVRAAEVVASARLPGALGRDVAPERHRVGPHRVANV